MKKIIGLGDSIMRGVIQDKDRSNGHNVRYSLLDNCFSRQCGERLGVEVDNFGKFGSTITIGEKMLERHLADVSKSSYTFLEYGGNDCDFNWDAISKAPADKHLPNTDLRTFSLTYKSLIEKIRNLGSKPILLSLTPLVSDRYFDHVTRNMDQQARANVLNWLGGDTEGINNWHETYNLQVFKIGIALDVHVIDISSAFLLKKSFHDYICADGIHPNEQGHKLIADAICEQVSLNP